MSTRLRPEQKRFLDAAVAAGMAPFSAPEGDGLGLFVRPPGRQRRISLLDDRGALTGAGKYFFQQRKQAAPTREFGQSPPVIEGRREYVALANGERALLRRYKPRLGWTFTKIGQRYYREEVTSIIVNVPAWRLWRHDNGQDAWERSPEMLQSTALDLGTIRLRGDLTDQQKQETIRGVLRDWVAGRPVKEGRPLVLSDSYSDFFLADDWEDTVTWNAEAVSTVQAGEPAVDVVLDRPLREPAPYLFGDLLFPHALAREALEGEGNCVLRQMRLVKAHGRPLWDEGDLRALMERAFAACYAEAGSPYEAGESWETDGPTARMVTWICEQEGVPVHVIWKRRKIVSLPCRQSGRSPFCFVIEGEHLYSYSDPKAKELVAKMKLWDGAVARRRVEVRSSGAVRRTPPSQWLPLPPEPEAGKTYYTDDLQAARQALHRRKVVPKVTLGGPLSIVALTVPTAAGPYEIRRVPPPGLQDVAEDAGVAYRGEGLEALVLRLFEESCRPVRARLPEATVAEVRARTRGKCAHCGDEGEELDHIVPLKRRGADDASNIQLLCRACHAGKSWQESGPDIEDANPLQSRFNAWTYEIFHKSRKPPQIVADFRAPTPRSKVWLFDVRRCRVSGLKTQTEIPVFSALDFPKPFEGRLGDYNWVGEVPVLCPLRALPYFGAGWYGRAACEFMLQRGIITPRHVELVFDASARLPAAYLTKRLERLEELFEHRSGLCSKQALLALLGLWSKPARYVYSLETLQEPQDGVRAGRRFESPTPGAERELWDVVYKTEVETFASMRPLHQLCLEFERIQVAKVVHALLDAGCPVLTIRVDGVFAHAPKPIRERFAALRHEGLDQPVFKVQEVADYARVGGGRVFVQHSPRPGAPPEWTLTEEPEHGDGFFEEFVRPLLDAGETFCCLAPPGMGKSRLLLDTAAHLRAKKERVTLAAYTHVAARRIGGKTLHKYIFSCVQRGRAGGWLLVDEVSMICPAVASALEHARLFGTKIVCFGDLDQLPCVLPSWRGRPTSCDLDPLLRLWSGGRLLRLTQNRRAREPEFNQWWLTIPRNEGAKEEALGLFPARLGDADWNLCLSHRKRCQINAQMQARLARGKPAVRVEPAAADRAYNRPQAYDLVVGTPLIGAATAGRIVNGALYSVVRADSDGAKLRDEELEAEFEVSLADLARHTRLRHAITIHLSQSRTLPGRVRVHELRSPHFTLTHLYVAASRCTSAALLEVVP